MPAIGLARFVHAHHAAHVRRVVMLVGDRHAPPREMREEKGRETEPRAWRRFYEGVMTANYTADATDEKIQANIVAAGYGN